MWECVGPTRIVRDRDGVDQTEHIVLHVAAPYNIGSMRRVNHCEPSGRYPSVRLDQGKARGIAAGHDTVQSHCRTSVIARHIAIISGIAAQHVASPLSAALLISTSHGTSTGGIAVQHVS